MAKRVLVTEPIIPSVIEELQKHFTIDVGERGRYNSEEQLKKDISPYHAILPMLSNPITQSVLSEATNLEVVANHAVGYNNIDLEAAKKHGIKVANTPGVLTDSCAEFTLGLMLAVARRFYDAQQYLLDGKFESWEPLGFLGMELKNKTLGIIGMGRIGQGVAKRARAMGMNIIYHNRNRVEKKTEKTLEATYYSSHKKLAEISDFLTLHCPLTEETQQLIDAEILSIMPNHAILINTSRGPVVDESALANALHNNSIGGAALDVFENEPEVHPKLHSAPNCLLTPHMASASYKTREDIGMLSANAIIKVLNGKPISEIPNLIQP
ncbi:2-hydroxyacid dehydrogenase [Fodinibius saliphilus]|uniref:2-hydroxyacid dehydrogenase n=1 Tax=Fodinibius saliphilus TaxID=1920650 RepID=UPI00110939C4|nr:D-glycerate dehydrogenase [Fodinibius saliphilus]